MRRLWPGRLAWLPLPVLLAAMAAFWAADWQGSYESDHLPLVLNLHFSLSVCLFIAYLVARSFLVRGTPGLLLLGCGVVIWGPASVVATAVARGDANISITIYHSCVWLSGLCHLAGVSLSLRPRRSLSPPALWLPGAYLLAAGAVILVTLSAHAGWLPTFFVPGRGGTPVRQVVLFSAIVMFALTALLLGATRHRSASAFTYWYALALTLIAAGLSGVLLQTYPASILGWTGRATQALGGLYMLIAAVAAVRETRVWGISLEATLRESEAHLASELAATRRLQEISTQLIQEENAEALYEKILDAAVAIMCSDFASIQMCGVDGGNERILHLLAWRGFAPQSARFWQSVRLTSATSCGAALRRGQRCVIDDTEQCDLLAGTSDLEECRRSGIRSMQSTPLISRSGRLVGMISTQWRQPHLPTEQDLGRMHLLARQAADLIEHSQARASLRESEERFHALVTASSEVLYRVSPDWSEMRRLHSRGFLTDTEKPKRTWFEEYIPPDDRPRVAAAIQEAIRTRSVFELEHRVRRADGSLGWTFSRAIPILNADGDIVEWFGAASDITKRKQAEEALRELNATLESRVAQRTAELQRRARQLQKLTLELSQAEERERRRIALSLHEDLQQQIAGAKFHLNLLRTRAQDDRQTTEIDQVGAMLKEAIEKSRDLSHDLSPAVLHMNDLAESLRWLAKRVEARYGLTVRADISEEMALQSEPIIMFLFRAAQELLFNVIKHARITQAALRARRIGRYMCLSVSDPGCGFDPQELEETSGFGLLSLRERVELLGGRMRIHSARGQGSRFRLVVPDIPGAEGYVCKMASSEELRAAIRGKESDSQRTMPESTV